MQKKQEMPLITIVMAVYNPDLIWFRTQLQSLNAQDYPNLELLLLDDCSTKVSLAEIQVCVRDCITTFPYSIDQNKKNMGSNDTFSILTKCAKGEFIAYCDQDDVWLPGKLSVLKYTIEKEKALLVYSDVSVIDADGKLLAAGMHSLRRRVVYRSGTDAASSLLFANFVSGCAMMMRAQVAKDALPCILHIVYDHWFALYAASQGKIAFVRESLVKHRVHTSNQTNTVADIHTKEDYVIKRIIPYEKRIQEINSRLQLQKIQHDAELWAKARTSYAKGVHKSWRLLWRLRNLDLKISIFELLLPIMPEWLFRKIIFLVQKGVI